MVETYSDTIVLSEFKEKFNKLFYEDNYFECQPMYLHFENALPEGKVQDNNKSSLTETSTEVIAFLNSDEVRCH